MNKHLQIISLITALALSLILISGEAWAMVKISGYIKDAADGAPLAGAHIQIAGTNWITAADDRGEFGFEDVPAGAYKIRVSFVGYRTVLRQVEVSSVGLSRLEIFLAREAVELSEVTVALEPVNGRVYNSVEIRKASAENLAAFLERAGEAAVLDGGGAKEARITIRGAKPGQVGVYLDGHSLNDPLTGEVDLKSIPVNSLDRIVVKPNPDLAEGASHPGGSVELYSAEGGGRMVEFGRGSFGAYRYGLELGNSREGHRFSFSYFRDGSQGDFEYEHKGVEKSRINDDQVNSSLYLKYSRRRGRWDISAAFHHLDTDRGAPGGIENPAPLDRIVRTTNGIALNLKRRDGDWSGEGRFSYYESGAENLSHYFWGSDTLQYISRHRTTAMELEGSLSRKTEDGISSAGVSYRYDGVSSSALAGIEDRKDFGVYLRRSEAWEKFRLSAAVRGDYYRRFGSLLSASMSGRLESVFHRSLSLTGNLSRGFSLPTFNQLFWAENAFAEPNRDLAPERMESWDVGLEWSGGIFRGGITYFERNIRSLIIWRETFTQSGRKWKPVNSDAARIRGCEMRFSAEMGRWGLAGGAVLSDPRNTGPDYNGKFLTFRPRVQTHSEVSHQAGVFRFSLKHRYLSRRYTLEANTKWVDPASIFDLGARWSREFGAVNLEIGIRAVNLLDEQYSIIKESPMPGRHYMGNVIIELD